MLLVTQSHDTAMTLGALVLKFEVDVLCLTKGATKLRAWRAPRVSDLDEAVRFPPPRTRGLYRSTSKTISRTALHNASSTWRR